MIPKRLMTKVSRLSEEDQIELMLHLARIRRDYLPGAAPAPPSTGGWRSRTLAWLRRLLRIPEPPLPPPKTTDDLLKFLRDDLVDRMADYLKSGGDPNISMNLGGRPIFFARSPAMVDLLLAAGSELDVANAMGGTAVHVMAWSGSPLPALQRVIAAGADPNRLDSMFATPLDVAERECFGEISQWLESIGAERGPLATHRRLHPLARNESATRVPGPMPSLVQLPTDRGALWLHLRKLISYWDPTIEWGMIDRAQSASTLNSLAGFELPATFLEFFQSGVFDWLLWRGTIKQDSIPCAWATAEAIGRRPAMQIIPVAQFQCDGFYCIERHELRQADPVVRQVAFQNHPIFDPNRPWSIHTGCRLSEFIASRVCSELIALMPARRYVDLESEDDDAVATIRKRLTKTAIPPLRYASLHETCVTIYEGPAMLYEEIVTTGRRRSYYGILGGDSKEALATVADT